MFETVHGCMHVIIIIIFIMILGYKPTCVMCTLLKAMAIFRSQAGKSLTKLSLAGNTLIIPGQGEFG
jgi:hypothetical protein